MKHPSPLFHVKHPAAFAAIRAAQNFHQWGRYAAYRYAEKKGASTSLVTLARQLQASMFVPD